MNHNYLLGNRDDNCDENEYFKKFSQSNIDKMFDNAANIHDDDIPIALVVDTCAKNWEEKWCRERENDERKRVTR